MQLKINPYFAQTLNNLGVIYTLLGRLDEALEYCRRAMQVCPCIRLRRPTAIDVISCILFGI